MGKTMYGGGQQSSLKNHSLYQYFKKKHCKLL